MPMMLRKTSELSAEKLQELHERATKAQATNEGAWNSTLSNLQSLKETIAKCRTQVKENPGKARHILKNTKTALKRECKATARAHKPGYQELASCPKAVDNTFVQDKMISGLANPEAFSNAQDALHRAIAEHFVLEGLLDVGQVFMQESGAKLSESLEDFRSYHHITEALHRQDMGPLETWLCENADRVMEAERTDLTVQYVKLRFVHLIADNKVQEALAFAHSHMPALYSNNEADLKRVARAVAYGRAVRQHPDFSFYFSTDAWTALAHAFTQTACALMGVQETSPLAQCITAGCAGVPVLLKWQTVAKATGRSSQWYEGETTPVQIPVDTQRQAHSVFVCPVSKEIAQPDNPPVLLTCGHAMCKSSALRLSEGRIMACPYCPKRMHPRELKEMHFTSSDTQ